MRTVPALDALPPAYQDLLDWYHGAFAHSSDARQGAADDPLLTARAAGRHLAGAEHPDDHVRRLRDSW